MKKSITLILLLCCSVAQAEWTQVVKGYDGDDFYFDLGQVQKINQDIVRVLVMVNFQTVSKKSQFGALSLTQLEEYDCLKRTYRDLSYTAYSGQDATGEASVDIPLEHWRSAPHGTTAEKILNAACSIK